MYGIFTHIYHTHHPNVGKYTTHGSYGYMNVTTCKGSDNYNNYNANGPSKKSLSREWKKNSWSTYDWASKIPEVSENHEPWKR